MIFVFELRERNDECISPACRGEADLGFFAHPGLADYILLVYFEATSSGGTCKGCVGGAANGYFITVITHVLYVALADESSIPVDVARCILVLQPTVEAMDIGCSPGPMCFGTGTIADVQM